MVEARILIEGTELSDGQAMTVRLALDALIKQSAHRRAILGRLGRV